MNFRLGIFMFIFLLVSLSACVSSSSPTVTETNAPVLNTPSEMPSQVTPTVEPDRQRIDEAKMSIKLPQDWSMLGPTEVSVENMPSYQLYVLGIDPVTSGGPGSSKIVIADPAQWTPEQFVLAQCSTCTEQTFEDVTLGGKSARRTQIGGGGVPIMVTWYFVENNGKLIALAIHDPETLEPLEDVLQSIQFE